MGSKVQGFKPALVRRDVSMKWLLHSYGIDFPSPQFDMPGLGQGFHSRLWTAFERRIYKKSVNFIRPKINWLPQTHRFGIKNIIHRWSSYSTWPKADFLFLSWFVSHLNVESLWQKDFSHNYNYFYIFYYASTGRHSNSGQYLFEPSQ